MSNRISPFKREEFKRANVQTIHLSRNYSNAANLLWGSFEKRFCFEKSFLFQLKKRLKPLLIRGKEKCLDARNVNINVSVRTKGTHHYFMPGRHTHVVDWTHRYWVLEFPWLPSNGYVHYRLRVTRHLSCPIYHHWDISGEVGQVIFSRCGSVRGLYLRCTWARPRSSPRIMTTSNRHRWIYVQLFLPCSCSRQSAVNWQPALCFYYRATRNILLLSLSLRNSIKPSLSLYNLSFSCPSLSTLLRISPLNFHRCSFSYHNFPTFLSFFNSRKLHKISKNSFSC